MVAERTRVILPTDIFGESNFSSDSEDESDEGTM